MDASEHTSRVGMFCLAPKAAIGRLAATPSPCLLDIPEPILQQILACSGSGGPSAACACSALRTTFHGALACPKLAACFLVNRFGPETAMFHVYGSHGLRRYLLCGQHDKDHLQDAATDKLIRELLRLGASPRIQARFLLTSAAAAGDTRTLHTLLHATGLYAYSASGNTAAAAAAAAGGSRALVAAAAGGHLPAMQLLLRIGVSARAENSMPLRTACREGHLAAVQLLLSHGADPRAAAGAALAEAARGGHLAVVSELLTAGGMDCRTPAAAAALAAAAAAGHDGVVRALLEAGAPRPQPQKQEGRRRRSGAAPEAAVAASAMPSQHFVQQFHHQQQQRLPLSRSVACMSA